MEPPPRGDLFRSVDSFGRSLIDETYTHEVPLVSERQTNVLRTKEWWFDMKEAYVISWDTSAPVLGGSN